MKGAACNRFKVENEAMARTAYTRLYATVSGTLLILLGLAGMVENSEFPEPSLWSELLGFYAVNGWSNTIHIVLGVVALLLAQGLSRLWAILAALVFLALGFWGVLAADGELLFGVLPATRAVNLINLLFGGFALAAFVASRWDKIRSAAADREQRLRKRRVERKRRQQQKLRRRRVGGGGESRPGSGSQSGTKSGPGSKNGPRTKSGPGSKSGSGSQTGPDSRSGPGSQTGPGSRTGSGPQTGPGSKSGS
jgi:hypothetical protein